MLRSVAEIRRDVNARSTVQSVHGAVKSDGGVGGSGGRGSWGGKFDGAHYELGERDSV